MNKSAPTDRRTLGMILTGRIQEVGVDRLAAADWERLIAAATAEGLSPFVYWTLLRSGQIKTFPDAARQRLSLAYAVSSLQNERMFRELEVLAHLFEERRIPAVALKGACFALTVYPEIGLRPMGDLDILVPADRLEETVGIAMSRGFSEVLPDASPGLADLLSHHVRLETRGPLPITLEIHDRVVGEKVFTYAVDVDWFWNQTHALDGPSHERFKSLRALTPAAQVLYAAAHAMLQHGGSRAPLRWFHDLHLLIGHYGDRLDWELLLSQAKTFEWGSALAATLSHTRTHFGTAIPRNVRASLLDVSDRHQALVTRLQIDPTTRVREEYDKLIKLNWHGRGRLVLALVAPSPSYMRWRYQLKSSWSLPAQYLMRWWGILTDGVRTLRNSARDLAGRQ